MNRREFLGGLAATALHALASSACQARNPLPAARPHVVCVLVDQLRQDAFERFAPVINGVARGGVVFEQMRSVAPWTYPSVISLLSGLLPQQHGADGHPTEDRLMRFDAGVPLLPQRLREAGYRTAAFTTNPFLREWNPLHDSFDLFKSDFVRFVGSRRPTFSEFSLPEMFAPSVNAALRAYYDAQSVGPPEFTYVHYIDVHGPWGGAPFAPDYRAAVEFVDHQIFELYQYFLRRSGGDLLFFVTSDHGLSLGDDLAIGDGPKWRRLKASPHEFNLRIPFVLLPSDRVTLPARIAASCSNVDFVPTLTDLLGLEWPLVLPGRSLAPALQGRSLGEDPPTYSRMSAFGSRCDGMVVDGRKYMRFFDVENGALVARMSFDLASDPREIRSLGDDFGPAAALIEAQASDRGIAFAASDEAPSPELEEQLRALGYLRGEEER